MTPTPDDLKVASQIAVLSGLNPRTVQTLLAQATVIALESGQTLFRQGETAAAFFIVIEGWVKLYRITPAGDEAVLNVFAKGESFAEAVAFTSGRYPAAASAATDARILQIPACHVVCCIREMPDIAIAMIASTSQHLHRLVQRVEQLTAQSALQRVAEFLTSLCSCEDGPCTVSLPYDKSLIAGRLGLQPESLSRAFAKLRSAGVDVRASDVIVGDVARLRVLIASDRIRARGMPARTMESRANEGRPGGSHRSI
ncbi:Crp/Fnr family transcriptional regulator [Bradyrhizobium sp.]|uniref:Crp/Fnr family transcriptional regulator n=1 Tax=Bradyrhizobium sp. TaxID=376 RepID=UPI003C72D30B